MNEKNFFLKNLLIVTTYLLSVTLIIPILTICATFQILDDFIVKSVKKAKPHYLKSIKSIKKQWNNINVK